MATITIRNVPEDVRDTLAGRAAHDGQSMQAYLLDLLSTTARTSTREEILDRVRRDVEQADSRVTAESIVAMLREDRGR